jgi:hypothetical protein
MAGGLAVKGTVEKITEVVRPKHEGSKVELPPGVDE